MHVQTVLLHIHWKTCNSNLNKKTHTQREFALYFLVVWCAFHTSDCSQDNLHTTKATRKYYICKIVISHNKTGIPTCIHLMLLLVLCRYVLHILQTNIRAFIMLFLLHSSVHRTQNTAWYIITYFNTNTAHFVKFASPTYNNIDNKKHLKETSAL